MAATLTTPEFQTEECDRCGGTGQYSFNGEHSRCYKCHGPLGMNGRQYTASGQAARDAFNAIARPMVPAEAVTVGQRIRMQDIDGKTRVRTVASIETTDQHIMFRMKNGMGWGVFPGTEIQLAMTEETRAAGIAAVKDMPGFIG